MRPAAVVVAPRFQPDPVLKFVDLQCSRVYREHFYFLLERLLDSSCLVISKTTTEDKVGRGRRGFDESQSPISIPTIIQKNGCAEAFLHFFGFSICASLSGAA